jgi:hypothetical protein
VRVNWADSKVYITSICSLIAYMGLEKGTNNALLQLSKIFVMTKPTARVI